MSASLGHLDHATSDSLQTMLACSHWRSRPERVANILGIEPRYVRLAVTRLPMSSARGRPRKDG